MVGRQSAYARLRRGAPLLVESLAWFTAMGVMDEGYGDSEQQRRLVSFMQETFETPRTPAVPLLRVSSDWFLTYRKGPLALHTLSRYIGREQINLALRRLLEKNGG